MKKKIKLPLSIFEIVSYSVLLLLGIWGVVYCILGFVCEFLSQSKSNLALRNIAMKNNTAGMGFLYQGFLIMGIAVVAAVIILLITAKKADREFEKNQRRAARLAKDNKVVDVQSSPVSENN